MIHKLLLIFIASFLIFKSFPLYAGNDNLVEWWNFDEGQGTAASGFVSSVEDKILGNFRFIDGARGSGLKFDGLTTRIFSKAVDLERLADAFTVEAWVAPQAYPWNWCAVVNQQKVQQAGYFFGIDAYGHVGLHLAVGGQWQACTSEKQIPYMAWSHIAGIFDKNKGIYLYIDGEEAAHLPVRGKMTVADNVELEIGRNREELPPTDLVREDVSFPASYSFDGIIDELKIYDTALDARQIQSSWKIEKPKGEPALKWRKWPSLDTPSRFGAVYTRLKFYREWDALWKVDDYPDIVVGFDDMPGKMVFWRGTNYNMNLVTENGRWVGDQSAEGGGGGTIGCCEHMSDKQCRYAHVRLLENNDARVVVHWRYALVDVLYRITGADPVTGWGTWADEYYTIYPDGIAVRHFLIHGEEDGYSITEPATLNQPGEKAEDNVDLTAIILANMKGQTRQYSWDPWPGSGEVAADFDNPLPNANICVVNFKSEYKPFYIYDPGTRIIPYGGGLVETSDFSHFPSWNHWPVSQPACDGRIARSADRFTSSAITSPEPPMNRNENGSLEGSFIMGLINQPFESLAPIARSWLQPPDVKVNGSAFACEGYDKGERAFVFQRNEQIPAVLEFEIMADNDSPVINPAFVVKNWGDRRVNLLINGNILARGKQFRYGYKSTVQGTDLVVWLKTESSNLLKVSLAPGESK